MDITRRNYLTAAGAALAAGALAIPAAADEGNSNPDTLYGHGMVWNRNLPGSLAELRLSFDLRLNLAAGNGFGTAEDPSSPEWGIHFAIDSIVKEKRPKGETRFTLRGEVTQANDPAKVDLPVRIIAETVGDSTAIAIAIGDLAFAGAGLVVIKGINTVIDLIISIVLGG